MFRIATEGATSDGRQIERQALEQMAANYDPKKYGARVWLEHMRGMLPDGIFKALGDVKALKAEEVEDGKLALFADIDPTDDLKNINANRQKIYTSMEVDPNFADSGQAYMVGLAVTDSPASLGTEMLQFSSQQNVSPLAGRKQRPENLFTAAIETELDFAESDTEDDRPSIFDSVKALFKKHDKAKAGEFSDFRKDLEQTLELFVKKLQGIESENEKRPSSDAFNELKTAHDKLRDEFNALHKKLDETPDTTPLPVATGAGGTSVQTNC